MSCEGEHSVSGSGSKVAPLQLSPHDQKEEKLSQIAISSDFHFFALPCIAMKGLKGSSQKKKSFPRQGTKTQKIIQKKCETKREM